MTTAPERSIYVSTVCLPGREPIGARLAALRAAGLDAIELGAGIRATPEDLAALSPREGPFLVHNYFPPPERDFVLNLASRDEEVRRLSLDMATRATSLCRALGAPFYSVHAGFITDPTGFGTTSFVFPHPASPREADEALDRFHENVDTLLRETRREGVGILVENNVCDDELRGKLLLQTPEEFEAFLKRASSPRLGVLLDTGHLNVTARTHGFDPVEFIDRVGPGIRAFHVHENDGRSDQHRPLSPGSWILDVLRREEHRRTPIVVESRFESPQALKTYVDWLRRELE